MGALTNILLVLLAKVVGAFLFSYAVCGLLWFLRRPFTAFAHNFPRRSALALAGLLTAVGVIDETSTVLKPVHANTAVNSTEALLEIYDSYRDSQILHGALRAEVAGSELGLWSLEELETLIGMVIFDSERHMDLLQSSLRGKVVRAPAPHTVFPQLEAAIKEAEQEWTPLLEAAAQGNPVETANGERWDQEALYAVSVAAASAQLEMLTAIEDEHGFVVPLSPTDRELRSALHWLPLRGGESGDSEPSPEFMESGYVISVALDHEIDAPEVFDLYAFYEKAGPIGRSYIEFAYHAKRVDLETALAVMGVVLGEGSEPDWDRLNRERRLLTLPVIDPATDLPLVRTARQLPWQLDESGWRINVDNMSELAAWLAAIEERWARISAELR